MFVAVDLPEMVLEDISDWGESALTDPALRVVPTGNLHITLAFLGNRSLEDVERIELAIQDVAEVPLLLELGPAVGRPARGRARVIALPVSFPRPVEARQAELATILASEGLYRPEKRPFWPHVTVARVRAEERGSRRPAPVDIPQGLSPTARIGFFDGVRISLYRSELMPQGARYAPLAQVELPGGGWR
jgi:RNA 2',3'-cyclic 3'-phosphodiesterase